MLLHQNLVRDTEGAGDTLDQILATTWIVSDIAIDVFGMLFWSGLGLYLLSIVT